MIMTAYIGNNEIRHVLYFNRNKNTVINDSITATIDYVNNREELYIDNFVILCNQEFSQMEDGIHHLMIFLILRFLVISSYLKQVAVMVAHIIIHQNQLQEVAVMVWNKYHMMQILDIHTIKRGHMNLMAIILIIKKNHGGWIVRVFNQL